jgi:Cytochrome P460
MRRYATDFYGGSFMKLMNALVTTAAALFLIMSSAIAESDLASYTAEGELIKPERYREWVTIGSGLNMAYGPLREAANGRPVFTNVFVAPEMYREFMQSGKWPERAVFVLEVRTANAVNKSASGNNGYFQGELLGIEAEVKDSKRFETGWGFFGLSAARASGALIPTGASCYSCHKANAAVENTFVQFYPGLREIAKEKGTFKPVSETF